MLLGVLALLAVLIASLSFHEAAHAWTAHRLGDSTARQLGRLTLNPLAHIDWVGTVLFPVIAIYSGFPLIGWARPVPVDIRQLKHHRADFALVAAAGPISNLILATGCAVLMATLPLEAGSIPWHFFNTMVQLNVLLAVFNMLPVPPLDGGNVLAGFVPESAARLLDAMRPYGFIILYALLYTGVFGMVVVPVSRWIQSWLL